MFSVSVQPQIQLQDAKPSLPPLSHIMTSASLPFQPQQPHQQSSSPPIQQQYVKREDGIHLNQIPQQRPASTSISPINNKASLQNSTSPKYLSKPPIDKCSCKHEGNHIPRPRNAFILFRQQHHQSVLDEGNVVKTNPDVSRELGKRWRDLSPPEKDYWNRLAEEEKKRHAEKYPGYRYIPRRFGKKGSCPYCKAKAMVKQQQNQHQLQLQQHHQQQRQQALVNHGLNQTPSSSTTPDESKNYSTTLSEEHAIAQSFLNLRNQPQHYYPQPAATAHHTQQYYPYGQAYSAPLSQQHNIQPPPIHQQQPVQLQPQQHFYFNSKPQLPALNHLDTNRSAGEIPRLQIPIPGATTTSLSPLTPNLGQDSDKSNKSCSIAHFLN